MRMKCTRFTACATVEYEIDIENEVGEMSYGEDYIFERTNELDKYTYPRFKSQELRVNPLENLVPTVIELVPGTGTNISTNT